MIARDRSGNWTHDSPVRVPWTGQSYSAYSHHHAVRSTRGMTLGSGRSLLVGVFLSAFVGCTDWKPALRVPDANHAIVNVAAAADLTYALNDIVTVFAKSHPWIEVRPTYGSSGKLYTQLVNRAPFDVFLSADAEHVRKLVEQGHAVAGTQFRYATGQIVIWVRNESPLDVQQQQMDVLLDPRVQRIAIANPQHAPYGRAAEAALRHFDLYDQVAERLALGENIAQAAQFVESGAADVGIIALSLAMAPSLQRKGSYWLIPIDTYPGLHQEGVVMSWAKDRDAATTFMVYLGEREARAILSQYGFLTPGD